LKKEIIDNLELEKGSKILFKCIRH
jgi:hypothetical protein